MPMISNETQALLAIIAGSKLSHHDKARIGDLFTLLDRPSTNMSGPELRRAREYAGLSLHQAAKILDVSMGWLDDLERCTAPKVSEWIPLRAGLAAAIDEAYDLGPPRLRRKAGGE